MRLINASPEVSASRTRADPHAVGGTCPVSLTVWFVVLSLVLAACGSSGPASNGIAAKSPKAILAAVSTAVAGLHSAHVSGEITAGRQRVTLDLSLVNGIAGAGSMSVNGASFKIVTVGQEAYINGSAAFWRAAGGGGSAGALLSGRWLKAPASGQLGSLADLTDLGKLFNQLLSGHGALVKGPITTVRAMKVVPLTDRTRGGTLYVATTGKPYPIEIFKSGAQGGQIAFDRFNQPVTLTPPAGAIDMSQLQAQ
jgi:hypothetical protein